MSSVLFGLGLALGIAIVVLGAAFLFGKKSVLIGIIFILLGIAVVLGILLANAKMNRNPADPAPTGQISVNTAGTDETAPPSGPDASPDPSAGAETVSPPATDDVSEETEGPSSEEPAGTPDETPAAPTKAPDGEYITVHYDPSTIVKPDNWNGSTIYLTFDDGPSYVTDKVLDQLKKYNVKATFFVIGSDFEGSRGNYIKRALAEGHNIGIHSKTHEYHIIYESTDAFFKDFYAVDESLKKGVGFAPDISRFPGGASNGVSKKYCPGIMTQLTKMVPERGFVYFDWNVSPEDAMSHMTAEEIEAAVFKELSKNRAVNVVLMHDYDGQDTTAESLSLIIERALAEGYAFDRLTSETAPVQHPVFN
ncbi:MAG: polysaccharide deacetylase family protein [Clostridia bacterium]|nr:polysaccharide deacetylase family protein [Clostridia bacterium]